MAWSGQALSIRGNLVQLVALSGDLDHAANAYRDFILIRVRYRLYKGRCMVSKIVESHCSAEAVGHLVLGKGLTSQFRPRQYYTIPKASLERLLDDVEQFINFFVIESQRIVFAENVYATGAVSLTVAHFRPRHIRNLT